jgi:DNA-binding GntR family transcriptional regulator
MTRAAAPTPAPAAEAVRAELEEAILTGRLEPGTRINVDGYARQAGISHIPVREALRALQADGWVVLRPHYGAFVRDRDPGDLADLFEARLLVEAPVVGLAAQRRTGHQLNQLDDILVRQSQACEAGALAEVNCQFHVALAECAHNATLIRYVADLNRRVRFYYIPTAAARRDQSLREHHAILQAVRDRDSETATDRIRLHISNTRGDVENMRDLK